MNHPNMINKKRKKKCSKSHYNKTSKHIPVSMNTKINTPINKKHSNE